MGSNDNHYEATWSVARAHKKATGKIQNKKWLLHNLDTDSTYTKEKEIHQEIARAIGLDFKQFCRTTLLAQGEFTRFLNSKDDEKAEILEKITGVDAYSKIGIKIFEKTSAMRKIWEEAQQKTAGITLLSDEEKDGKKAELETMAEQDQQIKATIEDINKKLIWIEDEQKLRTHFSQAQEAFDQIKLIADSDEKKEQEHLIAQWDSTIDARHLLQETKAQVVNIEKFRSNLFNLKNSYLQIQAGYRYEQNTALHIAQQKQQADDYLQKESSKVSLYENAQSITKSDRPTSQRSRKTKGGCCSNRKAER